MNNYLAKLIELKKMVGGKIAFNKGFATFQRLSKEDLEKLPEEERAYATTAMGRAVFQLGENGKIINYKGVDSHLDNSEAGMIQNVGALAINYTRNGEDYVETNYPLNLVIFLGQGADIRIRGASPLEDLEIEADVNARMKGKGIKLPKIKKVKEFPQEILEEFGLPIYVDGGKRPETVAEYLKRLDVANDARVKEFLKKQNLTIKDFSDYVDKSYSRGQQYGQAIRELESPFRVADLEILVGDEKNLPAIEAIVGFTESMHPTRVPFENYFARQMGINLGNMMNNGWECENFSHRQDYTLTGEMCDDSYEYVPEELAKQEELERAGKQELEKATNLEERREAEEKIGKSEVSQNYIKRKFFTQIYCNSIIEKKKQLCQDYKMFF